jgi:hypothetical protein
MNEKTISILKRLELIKLVASRDPASEKEARAALEGIEVVAEEVIRIIGGAE